MKRIDKLPRYIGCDEYEKFFFLCEPTDQIGHYIYKGETPNGGKSLMFIFMRDGQKTDILRARFVEIQELSENGALIHIEHGKADIYASWERPE